MTVIESDKALRYVGLLDNARLNGNWGEIPELARKVDKHAPHRKCLTLTATSEASIANAARERPSSSSSASVFSGLLDITPKLVQAVDQEKTYFEDAFQANVCLHEVYFLRGEWKTITGNLDTDVWQQVAQHTKNPLDISPNTRVAILKNRYFLGIAHEQQANPAAAAKSYQSALKAVQNAPANVASASEYRIWAERLLGRASLLVADQDTPSTLSQANTALIAFRNWSTYWDQIPGKASPSSTSIHAQFDVPRRDVWGRYYRLLSFILASSLLYSSSPSAPLTFHSEVSTLEQLTQARLQQRAELKRVETVYETLLLQETRFPQASQSNHEMEKWAQQAVNNWQIFCGSSWRDAELGEGGKAAVSRSMLDILYRAATKTFHSTPILRNLFNVHAFLAEFDLAMRAFDTYSEIITKGKSRAEKTGEHEIGLDTDDLVMMTAAQAIALLTKYGSRAEAEKALVISKTLVTWLHQNRPASAAAVPSHTRSASTLERTPTESLLSRPALAATYRAIGHAQANWARLTYEPLQRKDLQATALVALRRAAELASPPDSDPDTAVLLATTLAELRDFIGAIQVLKKALALTSQSQDADEASVAGAPHALTTEQRVAPLWHLLSLLLTARGEYENAVRVCEAAFEQLDGPALFDAQGTFDQTRPSTAGSQSIIDQMEDSVKESLIQIRITQLALVEVLDTPAAAAEASSSLLALYHKLFGTLTSPSSARNSTALAPPPPPQKASTLKSISGSIMGRKTGRKSIERPTTQEKPINSSIAGTERSTAAPVSIQVTNEDGVPAEKHHHHIPHHPFKLRGHHGDWREVGNLKQHSKEAAASTNGSMATEGIERTATSDQTLGQIPHNVDPEKQAPPLGHSGLNSTQDLRLPAPPPGFSSTSLMPRFQTTQTRRHHISLLIDIWLFTAGQYIRSELFGDAEGAIDEAHKLAENFQQLLVKEECSARAFDERGWGCGKSMNRLWADVHAERAVLAAARGNPHEALSHFEQALSSYADHPVAVVGISDILLDIYEQKIPPEPASSLTMMPAPITSVKLLGAAAATKPQSAALTATPPPAQLNRLAARDRAYMLLNTLSKLGHGYDDSETWTALARAHELSGQIDRARECLWWVVELEDGRPIRPWNVVSVGL